MYVKRFVLLLPFLLLLCGCATFGWDPDVNPYSMSVFIDRSGTASIRYDVRDSTATGTAVLGCDITAPNGTIYIAKTHSVDWKNGHIHTVFRFPQDFSINEISTGLYTAQCYMTDKTGTKTAICGKVFEIIPKPTMEIHFPPAPAPGLPPHGEPEEVPPPKP
ncbi:MAG: hypothetical protein LKE40_00715 [Spirochaetia bacterium]|jgi:hypothetical protein|nr:hypothetical protein [Spirochaetia bacterium]